MFESKLNIYYTQKLVEKKSILTIYWKSIKKGQIKG